MEKSEEVKRLESELAHTQAMLSEALPFARHVSVCTNHDGSKFQELADTWIEAVSNYYEMRAKREG